MIWTPDTIKARRTMLGLSQRQLASRSGVKQPLLAAIETGKRLPSAAVSVALERALALRPSVALAAKRAEVSSLISKHRGNGAVVFGSVSRAADTVDSDLDLLVAFDETADITDLLALQEELEALLTVPVDVVSDGTVGAFVPAARVGAVPL